MVVVVTAASVENVVVLVVVSDGTAGCSNAPMSRAAIPSPLPSWMRGAPSRSVGDSSGASGGEYDASIAGEPSLSS